MQAIVFEDAAFKITVVPRVDFSTNPNFESVVKMMLGATSAMLQMYGTQGYAASRIKAGELVHFIRNEAKRLTEPYEAESILEGVKELLSFTTDNKAIDELSYRLKGDESSSVN